MSVVWHWPYSMYCNLFLEFYERAVTVITAVRFISLQSYFSLAKIDLRLIRMTMWHNVIKKLED